MAAVRLAGGEAAADDPRWGDVLVAIDVGTSGARAVAFDVDGRRRLEARVAYPTTSPHVGWAEQDPNRWRSASLTALRGLVAAIGPRRTVRAIGLTGQCPTICLVDERAQPVRPGLIYRDNRATVEATAIREQFGDGAIHARTGHLPAAFHIAPKLLWVRDHEPDAWRRARLALQPRDLVSMALTGEPATDGTHAAATLVYDLRAAGWDPELQAALGLDPSLFPPIHASWEVVGQLRSASAARVGLPADIPVVLGGADSQACALGAGVIGPGPVSEMAGSSTCLNAAVPEPVAELAVTHYPHVVAGPFTTETGINTTGAAVTWLTDLAYGRAGRARSHDYLRMDAEAASVPAGSDGVQALPVLGDGERTDPRMRAAFTGLSLRHGRAALARATYEGVAYLVRSQLDLLRRSGTPVDELRVSGGDARLPTWNRVKADVIGVPVTTVPGDAAVSGVAMLAGIGAGVYASADEAIARCVHLDPPIEPDPTVREIHDDRYAAFRELMMADVIRRTEG